MRQSPKPDLTTRRSYLTDAAQPITINTTQQMGIFAPRAHVALLGADAVLGGSLEETDDEHPPPVPAAINKAGSLPLALCCRFAGGGGDEGVPVVVVSSDLKVWKGDQGQIMCLHNSATKGWEAITCPQTTTNQRPLPLIRETQ